MKLTKINLVRCVIFVLFVLFVQPVYANGGRGRDGSHHKKSRHYYKYRRYYPSSFYFRKRIYFYPRRRYYYYYDLYPEKRRYYDYEKSYISDNPDYLPVTSIANMASQGVPDSAIIYEIKRTKSKYNLDIAAINYLKQNGVGDEVIDYMLDTAR